MTTSILLLVGLAYWKSLSGASGYTSMEEIEGSWQKLIHTESCLVACQRFLPDKPYFTCEGSTLATPGWISFLQSDRTLLNRFLLSKIRSTTQTKVHVCPVEEALEGELAIYCLQFVNQIAWYDISPRYRDAALKLQEPDGGRISPEGSTEVGFSEQAFLRGLLFSKAKADLLVLDWQGVISRAGDRNEH